MLLLIQSSYTIECIFCIVNAMIPILLSGNFKFFAKLQIVCKIYNYYALFFKFFNVTFYVK